MTNVFFILIAFCHIWVWLIIHIYIKCRCLSSLYDIIYIWPIWGLRHVGQYTTLIWLCIRNNLHGVIIFLKIKIQVNQYMFRYIFHCLLWYKFLILFHYFRNSIICLWLIHKVGGVMNLNLILIQYIKIVIPVWSCSIR